MHDRFVISCQAAARFAVFQNRSLRNRSSSLKDGRGVRSWVHHGKELGSGEGGKSNLSVFAPRSATPCRTASIPDDLDETEAPAAGESAEKSDGRRVEATCTFEQNSTDSLDYPPDRRPVILALARDAGDWKSIRV